MISFSKNQQFCSTFQNASFSSNGEKTLIKSRQPTEYRFTVYNPFRTTLLGPFVLNKSYTNEIEWAIVTVRSPQIMDTSIAAGKFRHSLQQEQKKTLFSISFELCVKNTCYQLCYVEHPNDTWTGCKKEVVFFMCLIYGIRLKLYMGVYCDVYEFQIQSG